MFSLGSMLFILLQQMLQEIEQSMEPVKKTDMK